MARQRQLENGRAAVTLYFGKLGDLRSKGNLTPDEGSRFVADMQLIQALSGSPEIRAILQSKWLAMNRATVQPSASPTSNVAVVKLGSPDLIAPSANERYVASQFVAFLQAVEGRDERDILRMTGTLETLGFNVQAVQTIVKARSPRPNQVRYYRVNQKKLATQVAEAMEKRLCAPFQTVRLGGNLPNGVMEIWLGSGDDQKMPENCPA